jgi:hypothetical protein
MTPCSMRPPLWPVPKTSSPTRHPAKWNAEQVLAHVAIIKAATVSVVPASASGTNAAYDKR